MRAIKLTLTALALSAFAFGTLHAGTAAAQDRPAPRRAIPEADTTFDFDDDHVGGDYRRPIGERLWARRRPARESLVRARAHFGPELVHSIDGI